MSKEQHFNHRVVSSDYYPLDKEDGDKWCITYDPDKPTVTISFSINDTSVISYFFSKESFYKLGELIMEVKAKEEEPSPSIPALKG